MARTNFAIFGGLLDGQEQVEQKKKTGMGEKVAKGMVRAKENLYNQQGTDDLSSALFCGLHGWQVGVLCVVAPHHTRGCLQNHKERLENMMQ